VTDDELEQISQQLPALDVDTSRAGRIAARARGDLGRPRRRPWLEPIAIGLFVAGFLAWALVRVFG
jgi:hypothetical protein